MAMYTDDFNTYDLTLTAPVKAAPTYETIEKLVKTVEAKAAASAKLNTTEILTAIGPGFNAVAMKRRASGIISPGTTIADLDAKKVTGYAYPRYRPDKNKP